MLALQRLNSWGYLLAQDGGFTVQRAYDGVVRAGTDFGNSNDSVRFGIVVVLMFLFFGVISYLYYRDKERAYKDVCERLKKAEERLETERVENEKKLDTIRQLSAGHINLFNHNEETRQRTAEDLALRMQDTFDLLRRLVIDQAPGLSVDAPRPIRRVPRALPEATEENAP